MAVKITHGEWMAEIERAMRRSGDAGLLTEEIAAATGRTVKYIQGILRKLHRDGRLGSGRRPESSIDGRTVLKPVYWIKKKEGGRG